MSTSLSKRKLTGVMELFENTEENVKEHAKLVVQLFIHSYNTDGQNSLQFSQTFIEFFEWKSLDVYPDEYTTHGTVTTLTTLSILEKEAIYPDITMQDEWKRTKIYVNDHKSYIFFILADSPELFLFSPLMMI